jgi:putative ATPase
MLKKQSYNIPLADKARPQKIADFLGQEDLVGNQSFLYRAIENDQIPSMILWGPPGSGKTTLVYIIAQKTQADFLLLNAVTDGKKELLKIIQQAEKNKKYHKKTILFIDEIHRWNKSQQDALLPSVEKGTIILIGATTENPSFKIISALISRSRVLVFQKLAVKHIEKIMARVINKYYPELKIKKAVLKMIAKLADGDARMALNTLEVAINQKKEITLKLVRQIIQQSHLIYDQLGEEHYNIISALHKSLRGGDADAALYWLARMISGGEDPLYIARRLLRFAAEDVGLANNSALLIANATYDACHKLGLPECNVHLAQCVIYLAKSKKDITAYQAYKKAIQDVKKYGNLAVPFHLRNASTKLMQELGYGQGYKYTPEEDSSKQKYLPKKIEDHHYI